jgi:hypothetical protein
MKENPEPIFEPWYWANRLRTAQWENSAIFITTPDKWEAIENRHRDILDRLVQPNDSIFDAGCGWGRLLTMLPENWHGDYMGVDISPDFIQRAKHDHPNKAFMVGDLRNIPTDVLKGEFDWAIMISIRPMVCDNKGEEVWAGIEANLRQVAKKLLYLEYRSDDKGSIE